MQSSNAVDAGTAIYTAVAGGKPASWAIALEAYHQALLLFLSMKKSNQAQMQPAWMTPV